MLRIGEIAPFGRELFLADLAPCVTLAEGSSAGSAPLRRRGGADGDARRAGRREHGLDALESAQSVHGRRAGARVPRTLGRRAPRRW